MSMTMYSDLTQMHYIYFRFCSDCLKNYGKVLAVYWPDRQK